MTKLVGYCALHYGQEWLAYSIRTIQDIVDDYIIVYSPKPSHGSTTTLKCPETRGSLLNISKYFGARWIEGGGFRWEGEHRDHAIQLCKGAGADIVLVVDADEIWDPATLQLALTHVMSNRGPRNWLIGARHFWRSLKWICDDPCMPIRIIDLHGDPGHTGYVPSEFKFWHMGYAQSISIIKYKISIHGHKAEFRPGWYEDKFLNWVPGIVDVHPTNADFWYPQRFDHTELAHLIGDHPYYNLDIIT